jgi:hypothetical protein
MKISFTFAALLLAAMLARPASAGIVIDMDSTTAGIQDALPDLAAGPVTINMAVLFDPSVPDPSIPGQISTIGTNIHWMASPGVTVSLDSVNVGDIANNATPGASAGVSAVDVFGIGLADGDAVTPYTNGGLLGTKAGFNGSTGIIGFTDIRGGGFDPDLDSTLTELFTATFTVTGSFGDTVSFENVGILADNGGGTANLVLDGDFGSAGNINAPSILADLAAVGGSAACAAVPEPSSFALLGLVGFAAARIRRRKA